MNGSALIELRDLQSDVRRLIETGDLGAAMDVVRAFVDRILNHPHATTRVLASAELDELCSWIAAAARRHDLGSDRGGARQGTVVLVTELVMAGGHVELIKDFVALRLFEPKVEILLTDCFDRANAGIAARFAEKQNVPVTIAAGRNTGARFASVMNRLIALRPSTLVVLVNNQDTIGICAAIAAGVDRVVFVHHGDHHLSLGVTFEEFVHVDLANIAFTSCRTELRLRGNRYWPLVLRDRIAPRPASFSRTDGIVSCAAGRPEKFAANGYAYDYVELLPEILKTTGGRHVHIGAIPEAMRQRLERSFAERGIVIDRVKFIPWVPSVARALIAEGVDLYLGSFPCGGGKSTIEAMAAGIPLLMHLNYRHRMYCGADVAYPGAATWTDERDLRDALVRLTPEVLAEHSRRSRTWFEEHHSGEALIRAAAAEPAHGALPPPLAEHRTNELFAFLEDEEQARATIAEQAARIAKLEAERRSAATLFEHYLEVAKNKIARKLGLTLPPPS